MRRFAACATALGISLTTAFAVAGPASAATTHQARPAAIIVVSPGHSIQAAVNHAHPGDTVLLRRGVYHQSVQIRTDGITLRGSGNSRRGTVLKPPARKPHTLCTSAFGVTGVCILAKKVNPKNGAVLKRVRNDTITGMYVTGFPANGVFGYGTNGLRVTGVSAVNDGDYGISRFVSTRTLFAGDTAVGNHEAGFYVGDSPHADTVVRDNVAIGNQFGIFVRHARGVTVFHNVAIRNCEGILVLDDGQKGGAGNAAILRNVAARQQQVLPEDQGHARQPQGRRHPAAGRDAHPGRAQRRVRQRGAAVQLRRDRGAERPQADPREQSQPRHDRRQPRLP